MSDPWCQSLEKTRAICDSVGHYMTDVAELLLLKGYAITRVGSVSPEEMAGSAEADGMGYIDFATTVPMRMSGIPKDVRGLYLYWDTCSGWSLAVELIQVDTWQPTLIRWMGAGLTPHPEAVGSFFLSALLDIEQAGTDEQPTYRTRGHEVNNLMVHMAQFQRPGDFEDRFRRLQNSICHRSVCSAILSSDDYLLIPMRAGELAALERMVDFLDPSYDLEEIAAKLVSDFRARAKSHSYDRAGAVTERHDKAWMHALQRREAQR